MLGAIISDVIGSVYEFNSTKSEDFPLFNSHSSFTDDTVLTIAVAYRLLEGKDYISIFKDFTRRYPERGYGSNYIQWALSDNSDPYYSFGNGSAMRVSPLGFVFNSREEVLVEAEKCARVTHNHPEGIKGAQAVALAIFLARQGSSKKEIKAEIENAFNYNLHRSLDDIRPNYVFNETCQSSVPESIIAFLESDSFEDAVRKAASLGGDADTQACIAGGIAEAFYKEILQVFIEKIVPLLSQEFRGIIKRFYKKFMGVTGILD